MQCMPPLTMAQTTVYGTPARRRSPSYLAPPPRFCGFPALQPETLRARWFAAPRLNASSE